MKKFTKIFLMSFLIVPLLAVLGYWYIDSILSRIKKLEIPRKDAELGINTKIEHNELNAQLSKTFTIQENRERVVLSDNLPSTNTANVDKDTMKLLFEIEKENLKSTKEDILNIAVFGIDARSVDQLSRSDTIMLVSLNRKTKKIKLISFLRDIYVDIPEYGKDKLGHAYAYGGPLLAIKTLNTNFDLNIRNFVTINFEGFVELVERLKGIEVELTIDEAYYLNLNDGYQELNGRKALSYARMRKIGKGDYERSSRQRKLITTIYSKAKNLNILELLNIITELFPYIETNMSNIEILSLAKEVYDSKISEIEEFRVPYAGTFEEKVSDGVWAITFDIQKTKDKLNEFIYN